MIPKIIHYCWFGGKPFPEDVKAYMRTWKEHFPDFKFKQWDESNFDVNSYKYTCQAYHAKKFAFVSDVARLQALVNDGGLYFDTDILVKKRFPEEWFEYDGFGSFEHDAYVETGLLASCKGNRLIADFLDNYKEITFFKGLSFDMTPNVVRFTKYMESMGFHMNNKEQTLHGFKLLPQQLLCGKDWQEGRYDDDSTYAVHDYAGTWRNDTLRSLAKHMLDSALCIIKWKLGL